MKTAGYPVLYGAVIFRPQMPTGVCALLSQDWILKNNMKTLDKIAVFAICAVFSYGVFSLFMAFSKYVERFGL
jgi:hypothetical protein